jgi:aquaporin related protein
MSMLFHIVPYAILLFNSLIFTIARKVASKYSPSYLSSLAKEFIATLELCADCAELSVVYEVHGFVGYGVTLFGLCFWWARDWDDAEACPCGPIEDSFLCGIPLTSPATFMKLSGQILAAYFTWQ